MTTNLQTGTTTKTTRIPHLILEPLLLPIPHGPALRYRVAPHPRCLSNRFIVTKTTKTRDWSFPHMFTNRQFLPPSSRTCHLFSPTFTTMMYKPRKTAPTTNPSAIRGNPSTPPKKACRTYRSNRFAIRLVVTAPSTSLPSGQFARCADLLTVSVPTAFLIFFCFLYYKASGFEGKFVLRGCRA